MSLMHRAELVVFADYHQFYLWDAGLGPEPPVDWTDEDVARRAKAAPNVVVVCPRRDDEVPVDVEVHSREPEVALGAFDHVVRCSLALPTGRLGVHECTGGEKLRLSLAPGRWAVLALFAGLATVGAREEPIDRDRYRVVLWPADEETPLRVLRDWPEPDDRTA